MSQNRFGFQRPTTATASSTRTSRIPGTNITRTDTHTTVTEVGQCPSFPQQGGPTPSGLPPPRAIPQRAIPQRAPPPGQMGRAPGPIPSRGLQPPKALPRPSQSGISAPRGLPVPAASRSIPAPTSVPRQLPQPAAPRALQPPRAPGIPQPRVSAMPQGLPSARPPQPDTRQMRMPIPSRPSSIARPGPSGTRLARPSIPRPAQSQNEQTVHEKLMDKTLSKPQEKVSAKGKSTSRIRPATVQTPLGPETLLQKAVLEKRVERDATGETIIENLVIADLDEATGQMQQVELGVQQTDPSRPMDEGREVLGVISSVSVTASYTTMEKKAVRTITQPLDTGVDVDPVEVARLVEQEKEDVDNTLKMMPPDLELSPGRYELKSRLQQMRINSESMALLEQSVIQPELTADEAHTDPSPEVMASVMHTVETGVTPQAAPDEVFNSLFTETADKRFVKLSSVTPGPLQDVVVPTEEVSANVHAEVLSVEMSMLADRLDGIPEAEYVPKTDIFAQVMEEAKKSPTKGHTKARPFPMIVDERSLWVNANLEHLVHVVGAEPSDVLDPFDLAALGESGRLEDEMSHGVEYIVDCDPVQYVSRVQLRGTQLPSYFPGYLVALPEFPETVRVARSPDEVLASAWKSVQPKYFADESMHSTSF